MSRDIRRLVETDCNECVLDIQGFTGQAAYIDLLSGHTVAYYRTFRGRLDLLRHALFGTHPSFGVEINSPEVADQLIKALGEVRAATWGEPTP